MADVGKFLGSLAGGAADPAEGILGAAKGIIGMFRLDPTKKAEIAEQLTLANLDLEKTAMAGDIAALQGQIDIDKTEAQSPNWFIAGARPAVIWVCVVALAYSFIVQPFAQFLLAAFHVNLLGPLPVINTSDLVGGLLLPLLGLSGMRTLEKVQGVVDKH